MDQHEMTHAARVVALSLNKAERKGGAAMDDTALLIGEMIKARRELKLPATFGANAAARAAAAMQSFADGMAHLEACHKELVGEMRQLGFDALAEGDNCPPAQIDAPESTVVPLTRAA